MKTLQFIFLAFLVLAASRVFGYEKELQNQVSQGDWRAAERTLLRAENACKQRTDSDNCLDKTTFSRAWTYTQRSARDESNREGYLQRARDGYLAILERHPGHLPTIDNLILVLEQLGDRQQLERLLPSLQRLEDKKRLAKVTLMIAGMYNDAENSGRAFAYYARACELAPNRRAVNGLVAAFRLSPDAEKAKRIEVLAEGLQDVSTLRRLYEAILLARDNVEPLQWERAAVYWVAGLGKERMFTADLLEKSAVFRKNPEFRELFGRLRDPFLGLAPREVKINEITLVEYRRDGWWNKTLPRTWAFTIAAWSEGHNRLLKKDIEAANKIWKAALQFAPPSRTYNSAEMKDHWAVSLELLTDLARIQRLYKPKIDPEGKTFARIEQTLFFSKAQAYKVNDLEAIQRHHTVMGKMYADLGIFSERKAGVRSAEFQLKHAINTADRRSSQTGKADPQPQLAKLMADGYSCKLPSQKTGCKADSQKAQQFYLQSTRDYLKLDAVLPATKTLQNIKVTNPQTEIKVKQLKTIIDLRTGLSTDYLLKGKEHPDVVDKQIDIANQWQILGEEDKARDSIDQVLKLEKQPVDKTKVYKQLKAGEIETLKKIQLNLQPLKQDSK